VTPLRVEDITLYCEDRSNGRSQRILEAAVGRLRGVLPFAPAVRPVGVTSKNDVQVRTKFARAQTKPSLRVFGLRDRDFLTRPLVADGRGRAFDADFQRVTPWPLSRYCIESYLLDDDVLGVAAPEIALDVVHAAIDAAAGARLWLDVTRGTLEDLAYRLRKVRQGAVEGRPLDRAATLRAVLDAADAMRAELADASAEKLVTDHLDALAADMAEDGPLRSRVDGRELVYDLEPALGFERGRLLEKLERSARLHPPAALLADLREALEAMPETWRTSV
jgi:hypothetical protein